MTFLDTAFGLNALPFSSTMDNRLFESQNHGSRNFQIEENICASKNYGIEFEHACAGPI